MHWRLEALCRTRDPEDYDLTFTKKLDDGESRQERAHKLCEGCPVMVACAAEALYPLAIGTVRAGVWIPAGGRDTGRTEARQQLRQVVRDGFPSSA